MLVALNVRAQTDAPVRLALMTESEEAAPAADVLTAQLSRNPDIQLLERNEIDKVYREQGLSAANRDYLKLGRLLAADGLLLLNVVRTPQTTNLTARLVAVKPGVVLADEGFSWPLAQMNEWSASFAERLGWLLPKLTVLAKDAITISVVNLRSAISSAEAQETERQLKLLVIQRLSQERQLFVLERQRMQLLSEEKELKSDESAFWDGSYLLEGVVDQNGYSKETVTVNARLTPPKGRAPLLFEISGSRTNLAEVINRLATKVTELLKVNSTVTEWNAADEAQQYFEEAKWALRWGLYSEAQAAADSAWALGKHDLDCAAVRVKSYQLDSQPAGPNELYQRVIYKSLTGTPGDIESFIRETTEANHGDVLFGLKGNYVQAVILKQPPDPVRFVRFVHALELYRAQFDSLKLSDPAIRKDWCELGASLLENAGEWLRDYYLASKARKEMDDQLSKTRRLASEIAGALGEIPESNIKSYWNAMGLYGVLWCETARQGVGLYENLFRAHQFAAIRQHVNDTDPCDKVILPGLVDWTSNNDQPTIQMWRNLVKEMCASTNGDIRGNGYFIVCAEAADKQTFLNAYEISSSCFYGDDQAMHDDLQNLYNDRIAYFRRASLATSAPREEHGAETNPFSRFNPVKRSLSPKSSLPFPLTTNHSPGVKPTVTASRATESQPTNLLEVTRFWEIPLPRKMTFTNYFNNGEFVNLSTVGAPSSLIAFCYREGCLWGEAEHEWGVVHPRFFFRVNLETFTSECIPIEKDRYHPQDSYAPFAGPFRTFEVYSNHLYISSSDGIKRYSLARKTWEDLPVPVGGHARITAFDGRIFLTSASAIIEMSPDGQTSKVLASSRRRPPLTMLDTMDGYFVKVAPDWSSCKLFAPVLPGPDGSVATFLKGRFYVLAPNASDWTPWLEIHGGREAGLVFSPEGLLVLFNLEVARPPPESELYLFRAGSTNLDCLFADAPSSAEQTYLKEIRRDRQQPTPRWASPEGMRIVNWPSCLDWDTVWVLYGPPKDLTLLHFVPGRAEPVSYRLRLKPPVDRQHFGVNQNGWIQIEATPQGIVFGGAGVSSGLWFIPSADLQRIDPTGLSKQ